MASGSSARVKSGSKGFDFGSDDILCSYENYSAQENSIIGHSDPAVPVGDVPDNDFHKGRTARQSQFSSYSPQDDSLSRDVYSTVEKIMKKHTDNLMRFLEGISSRLSQLELYCYNLDKSIGEMRSDFARDNGEADAKLKILEKHIQEVHRSVQILRDKQELADTQKELAKLQLAQKEGSSKQGEEKPSSTVSETQNIDDPPEPNNHKLALALPHQVTPQAHFPPRPMDHPQSLPPPQHLPHSQPPPPNPIQPPAYYSASSPVPNPLPQPPQLQQSVQYLSPDAQYSAPQLGAKAQQQMGLPHYTQMWPSPPVPTQMRSLTSQAGYPPYPSHTSNTLPMETQFQGTGRGNVMAYGGYNGMGRAVQQQSSLHPQSQPPRLIKSTMGSQVGEAFSVSGQNSALSPGGTFAYDSEMGRMHHLSTQVHGGGYPPMRNTSQPQFTRSGPYGELVEKLVSMGYRGDHVFEVIQEVEESGQAVDFNSVLDRLNGHSSGPSQRGGW